MKNYFIFAIDEFSILKTNIGGDMVIIKNFRTKLYLTNERILCIPARAVA
jgi:hypothetical protein